MTWNDVPATRGQATARTLELVWLIPVGVGAVASVVTSDRVLVTVPLLAAALVPWGLQAAGRTAPAWLFGVLALTPVTVLLMVQGLSASVFLGLTALCLLASRVSGGPRLLVLAVVALMLPFASVFAPGPFDPGSFYFAIGDLFALTVGVLLGHTRRLTHQLRAADDRLLAARAQQERVRLARDVHDLVAHSLTVVVLHIGGARRILRTDPEQAEHALERAEHVCRESLDSIRRVVGTLRTADELPPNATDVAGLVHTCTAAGVPIEMDLDHDLDRIPLFVRSLVHRVIQEALANAARYRRPNSVVHLSCRLDDSAVRVVVSNATGQQRPASTGGYGLVGLGEQVADAGGVLTSHSEEGCWRVVCRLPLTPAPQPAPTGP